MNCAPSIQQKIIITVIHVISLASMCSTQPAYSVSSGDLANENVSKAMPYEIDTSRCEEIPLEVLKRIHGSAMDLTHMSADAPFADIGTSSDYGGGRKIRRKTHYDPAIFEIDEAHFEVLSNQPAWDAAWLTFGAAEAKHRQLLDEEPLELKLDLGDPSTSAPIAKRSGFSSRQNINRTPWRCETRRHWIRLPADFYPRHLRNVQCTSRTCWHDNYECSPKRVAVQILQRNLSGGCADATNLKQYGFTAETAEAWRWVRVSVSFYCECAKRKMNMESIFWA